MSNVLELVRPQKPAPQPGAAIRVTLLQQGEDANRREQEVAIQQPPPRTRAQQPTSQPTRLYSYD